jgi:hypothetical protein
MKDMEMNDLIARLMMHSFHPIGWLWENLSKEEQMIIKNQEMFNALKDKVFEMHYGELTKAILGV